MSGIYKHRWNLASSSASFVLSALIAITLPITTGFAFAGMILAGIAAVNAFCLVAILTKALSDEDA